MWGQGGSSAFLGSVARSTLLFNHPQWGVGKQGNLRALKGSDGIGTHHPVLIMYSHHTKQAGYVVVVIVVCVCISGLGAV